MGLSFTKIWARLAGKQDRKIVMVGLDAAGKTTVLYQLKLNEVLMTIPTIGVRGLVVSRLLNRVQQQRFEAPSKVAKLKRFSAAMVRLLPVCRQPTTPG
ncbi:unnamed protein product [Durusdinium trenchii]|uniref:Uncharacterized protein n=1 Tax=Durusdinium trenchii TaxID=1381693 RepID=A0ABP0SR91_9DINO